MINVRDHVHKCLFILWGRFLYSETFDNFAYLGLKHLNEA